MKRFNKQVKGSDQLRTAPGVEALLAFRALWRSEEDRRNRCWTTRPAYQRTA